jgi:hypothetical protein
MAPGHHVAVSFYEGEPDEALNLQAAQLCIDAGADPYQIPGLDRERTPRGDPRHS